MSNERKEVIELRGHHLKALPYGVQGFINLTCMDGLTLEAYDEQMGRKVADIYSTILENPEQKVSVTDTPDDICRVCPFYKNKCSGDHPKEFDQLQARLLGIETGRQYKSSELVQKIRDGSTPKGFVNGLRNIMEAEDVL